MKTMSDSDPTVVRPKINKAFRALRKAGIFARANWQCCQSCGCAALPTPLPKGAVFYHAQDAERLEEKGRCYMTFVEGDEQPAIEVARTAAREFRAAGLHVEWPGDTDTRILVRERTEEDAQREREWREVHGPLAEVHAGDAA